MQLNAKDKYVKGAMSKENELDNGKGGFLRREDYYSAGGGLQANMEEVYG